MEIEELNNIIQSTLTLLEKIKELREENRVLKERLADYKSYYRIEP